MRWREGCFTAVGIVAIETAIVASTGAANAIPTGLGQTKPVAQTAIASRAHLGPVVSTDAAGKVVRAKPVKPSPGPTATPTATPNPAPIEGSGAMSTEGEGLTAYEWRRLNKTPMATLTESFDSFRAMGGTAVALDISYVVDISEIADPTARAAAYATYTANLKQYTQTATTAGLKVEALFGDPRWVLPDIKYVIPIITDWVSSYNAAATPATRLVRLHADLEPWSLPSWSNKSTELTDNWLTVVALMTADQAEASKPDQIPITIDVAFWLDGTTTPKAVAFQGITASPTAHVIRLLDNKTGGQNAISVMAYRDTTGGPDGSIAAVAGEFTFAAAQGGDVGVIIAQEVGDASPSRITFFQEGPAAFADALTTLRATYESAPAYRGFAVDDMASLRRWL